MCNHLGVRVKPTLVLIGGTSSLYRWHIIIRLFSLPTCVTISLSFSILHSCSLVVCYRLLPCWCRHCRFFFLSLPLCSCCVVVYWRAIAPCCRVVVSSSFAVVLLPCCRLVLSCCPTGVCVSLWVRAFFGGFFRRARRVLHGNRRNANVNAMFTEARLSLPPITFIFFDTKMMSKQTKERKEIQDEAISKEDFLDMFNSLVKIQNDMRK